MNIAEVRTMFKNYGLKEECPMCQGKIFNYSERVFSTIDFEDDDADDDIALETIQCSNCKFIIYQNE